MDPASLLGGMTRETTIARDAQGRWFHDGQPLDHPNLTRAFDRWVQVAEDGRYCLKNDINWAYIALDGAPYFVRAVRIQPGGAASLRLSDDSEQVLDAGTLRQGEDGALYCDVHGSLAARFDRLAMQQLEALLGEDEHGVYLALGQGGPRVRPPVVENPLAPQSTSRQPPASQ